MRNQCIGKKVYFKGRCVNLNENGGCPKHLIVQIDSTSLQLTCTINFGNRNDFGEEELTTTPLNYTLVPVDDIGSYCLVGGKRSQEEKCISTPV